MNDQNLPNVTFLGLGIMGSRMAGHLQDAGTAQLTVWNRSIEPRQQLADRGAATAESAVEAVRNADVVISMLAKPEVIREVILEGGVLEAMPDGALWADCSTVDPAFARTSAAAAGAAGIRYAGTPVAGTRGTVDAKQLKVLAGGAAADIEELKPLFAAFSVATIHVGEKVDRGAAFKILINGMLAQSMLVFNETLRLGRAQGLPDKLLYEVLPSLPVIAPFVGTKIDMLRSGSFDDVSFPLELMHKDLALLTQTAYELDEPLYLASVAREVYGKTKQAGYGRADFSAVGM